MPVARDQDELTLLKSMVAAPDDLMTKLDYARYLREREDSKGERLQRAIETDWSPESVAQLDDCRREWRELTGVSIADGAIRHDLREWIRPIQAVARPALRIIASEANYASPPPTPSAMATTRLGGDPDLASAYPFASDGRPMIFIGQFNMSSFRGTVVEDDFPPAGLMSIFRTAAVYGHACLPEDADLPRLVQFAPDTDDVKRTERPDASANLDPSNEDDRARLEYTPGGEPFSGRLPYRESLTLVETLSLPVHGLHSLVGQEDLGFRFEQDLERDPFLLLGHAAHANTGDDPAADNREYLQLLRLPYSEGPDFGMSDCNFSLYIPRSDLRVGRVDRVISCFG